MNTQSIHTLVNDNNGNKYYFYYDDSSIFCREIPLSGEEKNTLLINQVNERFLVTTDSEKNLYLVCYSKYKGIIMLMHSKDSWELFDAPITKHVSNAVLLDVHVVNDSVHIIYATSLPLVNFYNVHHLKYDGDAWSKSNITEIYAEKVEDAFAGTITEDGCLHFVCLHFDGKEYYINYSVFDSKESKWQHSNIVTLFDKGVCLRLLKKNDILDLIVYCNEDDTGIIFNFEKRHASGVDFEFKALNKISNIPVKANTAFYISDECIKFEYFFKDKYERYLFDVERKDWLMEKQLDGLEDSRIIHMNHISISDIFISTKQLLSINDETEKMQVPLMLLEPVPVYEEQQSEQLEANKEIIVNNIDEFIPYLVEQIKVLSENIKIINQKLTEAETPPPKRTPTPEAPPAKAPVNNVANTGFKNNSAIKSSNFKERFMSNDASFSGFKQNNQSKSKSSPSMGNSTGKIYTQNSSFRDNFINNDSLKNSFSTSAVFRGNKMSNTFSNDVMGIANNEKQARAVIDNQKGSSFIAFNDDSEDDSDNIDAIKTIDAILPPQTAPVEIIPETQNTITQPSEAEQKKSNNILKMIGDFFK